MNSYVLICITGKNPKLFFKRFILNKIPYSGYKEISYHSIKLKISYQDYLKIKDKNSIYDVEIIKMYGVLKYVHFLKHNLQFILSFILSLILLWVINNIAFEVVIVHDDSDIRKLVSEELKSNNISKYKFIPSFNKRKKIIDKIIKENKNVIEWMEIERTGSKLTVKVTERKINKSEEKLENRHIVAKKSGIIIKVEASKGVIMKKKNDYVAKGDIIVSGDIIKDETVKGQVVAKGKVYAETWYRVKVEYPLYYEEIKYLPEVKNNYIISFMGRDFALKKNYTSSYLEKKKTLIKDKVFPFAFSVEKQRKTKVEKQTLSKEEAIKKAEELAEEKIKAKLDTSEYIISRKTLNFSANDSKILVDVFFKVCEDITDYRNTDPNLLNVPQTLE